MPKYWGKQIFTHGSFSEVGQKQNTEKTKKKKKRRERLNDGDNNGQATHGAQACMAHASRLGQQFILFSIPKPSNHNDDFVMASIRLFKSDDRLLKVHQT